MKGAVLAWLLRVARHATGPGKLEPGDANGGVARAQISRILAVSKAEEGHGMRAVEVEKLGNERATWGSWPTKRQVFRALKHAS